MEFFTKHRLKGKPFPHPPFKWNTQDDYRLSSRQYWNLFNLCSLNLLFLSIMLRSIILTSLIFGCLLMYTKATELTVHECKYQMCNLHQDKLLNTHTPSFITSFPVTENLRKEFSLIEFESNCSLYGDFFFLQDIHVILISLPYTPFSPFISLIFEKLFFYLFKTSVCVCVSFHPSSYFT